jgi:predicted Zn-dependent protease with MMP-like domain
MDRREFERLVAQACKRIPREFRQRVENVAIVVEPEPSRSQLRSAGVPPSDTLLGLYQGVPLTQRGSWYQMVLPDKISLFQGPIEREARNSEDLPRVIYETLWHELAHYFGMEERQVRRAERRRRRKEQSDAQNPCRNPGSDGRDG